MPVARRHRRPTSLGRDRTLSPLLANILLDDLDRELERRGHRFARYADDLLIVVRSARAGDRVKASVTRYLTSRLKLKVNGQTALESLLIGFVK